MIRALIIAIIAAQAAAQAFSGHYTKPAIVRSVENDLILVETDQQQIFGFYSSDFEIGDKITVLLDGQGTEQIEDDAVVFVLK